MCKEQLHAFPQINQLLGAVTDLLKSTTCGSDGLLCSRVGPCRVSITQACEVAPGLPQGAVNLSDGARILYFT